MAMPVGRPPESKRNDAIARAVFCALGVMAVLAGAWSIIRGLMRWRS